MSEHAEPEVAVRFENTGPPPHANGEDWRAYFTEYRAGLETKAEAVREKARRIEESGKFAIVEPVRRIELEELTGPAATFANLIVKAKPEWPIEAWQSRTHHEPTLYVEDDKQKNENEPKKYVAGDVRYPQHDEIHQSIGVAVGRGETLALRIEAHFTQIVDKPGAKDSAMSYKFAKVYVRGIGWDSFQAAGDFTEWQYALGLKARPKPKNKPEPEDPLMAPLQNGEWHA